MTGIVGSVTTITSGLYNLYTVPVGKVFEGNIYITSKNPNSTTVKTYISPTTSPTNTHLIQLNDLNSLYNSSERLGLVVSAGEVISCDISGGEVSVVVTGIVRDSSNLEFKTQALITTNTETQIHSVPASTIQSVSIAMSLVGNSSLGKSDVEVYITPNLAVNGRLIFKDRLEYDSMTGFQMGGIILNADDRLVVVTANTVGSVSTRVSGFKRLADE